MSEPKYENNRFWAELPHTNDGDGLCWCDPKPVVISCHYDMIREFGGEIPGLHIPCTIWKHRKEH